MAISKRFVLAKAYSRADGFFKDNFNIHLRGLGFLLRQVKHDQQLLVQGRQVFFSHGLAEAYARPLHGQWNEPETHGIIAFVMDSIGFNFVDVGANIGEILVDIAANPACIQAIAFEPNPAAVEVISENIELNKLTNCAVVCKALGHIKSTQKMSFGSHSPSASLLAPETAMANGVDTEISTLDCELHALALPNEPLVLLIDVEGYELNVIRGGKNTIRTLMPMIIFEYHRETQKIFSIADMQRELGDAYEIYRIRRDALLDRRVDAAWNCVAVPRGSRFKNILQERIIEQ